MVNGSDLVLGTRPQFQKSHNRLLFVCLVNHSFAFANTTQIGLLPSNTLNVFPAH